MGSEEAFKSMDPNRRHQRLSHTFFVVLILIASNALTAYFFYNGSSMIGSNMTINDNGDVHDPDDRTTTARSLSELVIRLLEELNRTRAQLESTEQELMDVREELRGATPALLDAVAKNMEMLNASAEALVAMSAGTAGGEEDGEGSVWGKWKRWMRQEEGVSRELQEFTALRALPLGFNPGQGSDTLVSSVGHACALEEEDLRRFMEYEVRGDCPDDQSLAQRLLLHGCEPLPRRRCFARAPPNFTEPLPLPASLWTLPADESILWSAYSCKSFACLNARKQQGVFDDCNDCFDLQGKEKDRWEKHGTELDFSIEEVIGHKKGTIRIGLDIGGGSASFAVRMRNRGITIVTTSMNLNGPFNNFIALRGVVPLYITISQRLPFFDNTLDLVHSMHVLSHWIPLTTLEFLLFDIDRVLRPGGIFWLDRFFCGKVQLSETYVPMIKRLGYVVRKWAVGPKLDRRGREEIYLSAVLEKPLRRRRLPRQPQPHGM